MDGMRKFYERELHEVRGELQFVYKKWSSSLVDCWRLRDEEVHIALTIFIIYRERRGARSLKRDSSGKLKPHLVQLVQ